MQFLGAALAILKTVFSGGIDFLSILPQVFSIYNSIKAMVGQAETTKFLSDLDESTAMVLKSKDMSLPVEVRRKMRQDALEKSRDLWGRIT